MLANLPEFKTGWCIPEARQWVLAIFAFCVSPVEAGAEIPADLELVLAIDTSTSVDAQEFALQKQGLYEAFLHPEVVRAIQSAGEYGVAVSVVQWAGSYQQQTVVDWMLLRDEASAAAFAARIGAAPRAFSGLTDIAGVIRYSTASIESNAYAGKRRAIDISGDGTSDIARCEEERDLAVSRGVTINGLVIYSDDHDLGALAVLNLRDHYAFHVIGGPGAFLMSAENFEDFRTAIRRKLLREIIGVFAADAGNSSTATDVPEIITDFDMNQGISAAFVHR